MAVRVRTRTIDRFAIGVYNLKFNQHTVKLK